mmetsp:Transcript_35588/g.42494  ORF Transcript_35588/g.42494 Transcript_35588/m.42494 type:complete len:527 (+) Transcript_35588:26-1606(+)
MLAQPPCTQAKDAAKPGTSEVSFSDANDHTDATDEENEAMIHPKSESSLMENGIDTLGAPSSSLELENNVEEDKDGSRYPKRLVAMVNTAEWWSLWIGFASFWLAFMLAFVVPYNSGSKRAKYTVPQPMKWQRNPFDAWDTYGIVGTLILLTTYGLLYLISLRYIGKISEAKPASMYCKGFASLSSLALISFWIGRNAWCLDHGLGYAVISIILGMLVSNFPGKRPSWLLIVAKDGEFFVKCSLVLLAVEFSVIGKFGWQAFVVSWIGSPIALIIGYLIGTRWFKMVPQLALLIAAGSTWCGASAISAVGATIGSSSEDIAVSISIVAFFTVIFTFIQAYFAIAVGMDDNVAGAWIGGSVDQTGNVLASAAIVSEEAAMVAGVVKIILNSGLGILITAIAFWWQIRSNTDLEEGESGGQKKRISLLLLWDKFPKFVLGYLICSGILTIVLPRLDEDFDGEGRGNVLRGTISTMNKWWFAVAFVGIGVSTNIRDLWHKAVGSGVIKLYLVANTIDVGLALALAYAVF